MAKVYLAQLVGDHGFQKQVAVKILRPEHSTDRHRVSMFIDEVRVSSRIQNVNVCTVFDFGVHEGMPYLVMEYLEGVPLSGLLRRRGNPIAIEPRMAARIIADAAQGLHAAHELVGDDGRPLGVIHRDVSPQNIFILSEGAVKVLDFGIAKMRGRLSETQHPMFKGKPCYAAPEQFGGAPIDRRTDVWALGVILWEATTGDRLFSRTNLVDTAEKIVGKPAPKPSEQVPDYPAELEDIVMSALERDPDRRIPTAMAIAERLSEFIYSTGKLTGSLQLSTFVTEHLARQNTGSSATDAGSPSISRETPAPTPPPTPNPSLYSPEASLDEDIDQPLSGQGFDPTLALESPSHHQPPLHLQTSPPILIQASPSAELGVEAVTKPFINTPESPISDDPPLETHTSRLSLPLLLVILFVGIGVLSLIGASTYVFFQSRRSPAPPSPHMESLVGVTPYESSSKQGNGQDDGQISSLTSGTEPTVSDASLQSHVKSVPLATAADPAPDASISPQENSVDTDFSLRDRRRHPPLRQESQGNRDDEAPSEANDDDSNHGSGSLNLLAVPQSDVYWRGRKIGRTPLFEYSFPAGRHALELRSLDGESRHTVRLAITDGNTTRRTVRY